jgi:hypothetical protein
MKINWAEMVYVLMVSAILTLLGYQFGFLK